MKGASGAHGCGIGAVRAWSEARDFRARRSRRAQTASAFHGIDEAVKLLAFTQFKTESRFHFSWKRAQRGDCARADLPFR
ncbi:hypothetical protein SAMN05216452_1016 [Nitratireductor aquibiodomus]|uniref:Uncharacterized protein n=1 Tax=Nitratireductor aquibiodomus TaxID=204799 RepID=A0A1H4J787_9HYPH|nr:hypothetical protein SAMN05216452_1016 [Nitratireductor aquibiodomus]